MNHMSSGEIRTPYNQRQLPKFNKKMSVKITKLAFYPFSPNPDLLFYYATIDTLTFRGIATPELAEDLVAFFANDEGFECEIEERQDGSFKLTQLLSRPTETPLFGKILTGINLNSWEKQKRNTQEVVIQPKQISIFKRNNKLKAVLKHKTETGEQQSIFGDVDKSWIIWYLLMLRQGQEVTLALDKNKTFYSHPKLFDKTEYYKRSESTYIDNPKNFSCANVSPDLKQPILNKEVKTK